MDKSWNTEPIMKDESKSLEVVENMLGEYVCRFHVVMKGKSQSKAA